MNRYAPLSLDHRDTSSLLVLQIACCLTTSLLLLLQHAPRFLAHSFHQFNLSAFFDSTNMSGIKTTPSDDSYVELSATSSQSSNNSNGLLLRALTIASATGIEVNIPVPSQPFDAWIVADVLREEFQRSLASSEANDVLEVQEEQEQAGAADKAAGEAKINLAAKFLGFLASRATLKTSSHELNLLQHAWAHFHDEFLATRGSVHDLVAAIDSDLRTPVLRSYFEAYVQLESAGQAKPSLITPKLFSLSAQNKAEVHAVFGGQGNNEVSCIRFSACTVQPFSEPDPLFPCGRGGVSEDTDGSCRKIACIAIPTL